MRCWHAGQDAVLIPTVYTFFSPKSVPSTSRRQEMDSFLCRCCHQYLLKPRAAVGRFALAFSRTSVSLGADTWCRSDGEDPLLCEKVGAPGPRRQSPGAEPSRPALAFPGASDSLLSQHQHSFEEEVRGMSNRLTANAPNTSHNTGSSKGRASPGTLLAPVAGLGV